MENKGQSSYPYLFWRTGVRRRLTVYCGTNGSTASALDDMSKEHGNGITFGARKQKCLKQNVTTDFISTYTVHFMHGRNAITYLTLL
jgi:hypothetical protein